jgi:hypothetical protein
MKKNFTLLALIMMALAVTFVSCTDDDEYEAYTLEGAWEGDMGVMINGYVADYSTIYFDKNPYQYASGEGYQVDYFGSTSPWYHKSRNAYYVANHIRWQVTMGVIQLYYVEEDIYAEIRDYSLSSGYFTGYIDFEDGSSSTFRMQKTYSPNNWGSYYEWGWYDDYYYGGGYYYSKKGVFEEDSTRASANATSGKKLVRTAAVKQ